MATKPIFLCMTPQLKKLLKPLNYNQNVNGLPSKATLLGQLQSTWVKGQLKFAHNKFMGTANGEALIFQALPL